MRRLSTALFLLIISLPMTLVSILVIKQIVHKSGAVDRLEKGDLVTISIPEGSFQWVEDDEITINGRMFDFRSYYFHDGMYSFIGHYDDKETDLSNCISNSVGKNNQTNKAFAFYFKLLQFLESEDELVVLDFSHSMKIILPQTPTMTGPAGDVSTPPPQRLDV